MLQKRASPAAVGLHVNPCGSLCIPMSVSLSMSTLYMWDSVYGMTHLCLTVFTCVRIAVSTSSGIRVLQAGSTWEQAIMSESRLSQLPRGAGRGPHDYS